MDDKRKDINKFYKFAEGIAGKFYYARTHVNSFTYDDAKQAAYIGLLNALDNYDASKKCPLRIYIFIRVLGSLRDEVRRYDPLTKTQRRQNQRGETSYGEHVVDAHFINYMYESYVSDNEMLGEDPSNVLESERLADFIFSDLDRQSILTDKALGITYTEIAQRLNMSPSNVSLIVKELKELLYTYYLDDN